MDETHRFFDVDIRLPAGWDNHSTLLFTGPPMPAVDGLPTVAAQQPLHSGSVVLQRLGRVPGEVGASELLAAKVQELQAQGVFLPKRQESHEDGAKSWAWQVGTVQDVLPATQLVGVALQRTGDDVVAALVLATAPAAVFATQEASFVSVLQSVSFATQEGSAS